MKRIVCLLIVFIFSTCLISCKKSDEGNVSEPDVQIEAEFSEMVEIFKGFENIIERNQKTPEKGVQECTKYVDENISKIKSIESVLKNYDVTPDFVDRLLQTNNQIKEVGDNVTKTVVEHYGIYGADVIVKLSDMALARL